MAEQVEIPEDIMQAAEAVVHEWNSAPGGALLPPIIARAILGERERCTEVARSWEQTAKNVRQIEGEGVARDIRLCIAAGIPASQYTSETQKPNNKETTSHAHVS